MTKLIIIDYGSGNLRSVAKACERAMLDEAMDGEVTVSSDPQALEGASHLLLPGVGAFGDCMQGLKGIDGMLDALDAQVHRQKKWFLGICVGMQLLFDKGYEHGTHDGLGWIPGEVKPFDLGPEYKVPHMGWNQVSGIRIQDSKASPSEARIPNPESHLLLNDIDEGEHAYFVHSYHAQEVPKEYVLATTEYGGPVVAAVGTENIFGTQFHPEKSQAAGLRLLANFLQL